MHSRVECEHAHTYIFEWNEFTRIIHIPTVCMHKYTNTLIKYTHTNIYTNSRHVRVCSRLLPTGFYARDLLHPLIHENTNSIHTYKYKYIHNFTPRTCLFSASACWLLRARFTSSSCSCTANLSCSSVCMCNCICWCCCTLCSKCWPSSWDSCCGDEVGTHSEKSTRYFA